MEDWESKRLKKQKELAQQLLKDETYSFRPNTRKYDKKLNQFPKNIAEDHFLLEGMMNFLDKQGRAREKKIREKEVKGEFF